MAILFYENEVKAGLKHRRLLKSFMHDFLKQHHAAQQSQLQYVFCNDEYLLQMNQQFLQHDTLTDIITFDLSESPKILQAEIYISSTRVKENAAKFDVPYEQELRRVIFHGMLHLCGFKDKNKDQQQVMRHMENQCLQAFESILAQA